MALVLDTNQVLAEVLKIREQLPYNVERDAIVETLNADSPKQYGSYLEFELDQEEVEERFTRHTKADRSINPENKGTTKVWAPSLDKAFVFEKCDFKPVVEVSYSGIAEAIRRGEHLKASNAPSAEGNVKLVMFLPSGDSLIVLVPTTIIVEDLIKTTLQQYGMQCSDSKKKPTISLSASAYILKFAEDDGSPDDDTPALVKSQSIKGFRGIDRYALCLDTTFKANSDEYGNKALLFKVFLPKEEGFVSTAFDKHIKLGELLQIVARKRALTNPDDYFFEDYETGAPLTLDMTLGEIPSPQVRIVLGTERKHKKNRSIGFSTKSLRKTASNQNMGIDLPGDAPKAVTKRLGPIFHHTPHTASKYQAFQVIKVNKFGKAQERMLAIDAKKMYNFLPEKGKTADKKTKRPERYLIEVSKVNFKLKVEI
eukprot:TRINITY_DN1071_c0_g2_i8.p1 TRINITY_DN1071_c0_g2~~TRINITY_DN1071_c0_g2_i8.p1  ORF type:complete len:426 (+),score=134.91 TRINITY_DN1071_c0_g2_i8:44-1321(+)